MSPQDSSLIAERGRRADDPLAVEIDASRIAPESWQPVNLAALGMAQPAGQGIEARFGLSGLGPVNDNRAAETTMADPIVVAELPQPPSMFITTPPANDDLTPARPLRVIRRRSLAELAEDPRARIDETEDAPEVHDIPESDPLPEPQHWTPMPQRVTPLPVAGPIAWQTPHRASAPLQRLDRSAVNALVVIMIAVWAIGMAFAVYKLSVPGSGAAIQWRS